MSNRAVPPKLALDVLLVAAAWLLSPAPASAQGPATSLTTVALAQQLKQWQLQGDDVAFIIGGPDGLDPRIKDSAHETLRLSSLTLPHALVRVVLAEALYRAHSVTKGHPYHRD